MYSPLEPELYHISNSVFLNGFYRYLINGIDSNPLIFIFGLIALLFEIIFSRPLVFLFSQLPLGNLLSPEKKMTIKLRLIPALLIGISAAADMAYAQFAPESFASKAELLNWIFLVVIGIAFLIQLGILLSGGGVWRSIVSGGLLIAANTGVGALLGILVAYLCLLLAELVFVIGFVLLGIVILLILSAASTV